MALLTISIPIYNRSQYLTRMLDRFMLDRQLFDNTIYLFISDNCSDEDLYSICKKYQAEGLRLEYNRNDTNLGMDGNFEICINKGIGSDYLWVLGSDDIPTEGFFDILLPILKKRINSIHLSNDEGKTQIKYYNDVVKYLKDINVMITFLSGNIISTRVIPQIDLKKYQGTFFTQVPVYLSTIFTGNKNVFIRHKYLQDGNDSINNGGYNFYKVFVECYFSLWNEYVQSGLLSKKDYEDIKRTTFLTFHWWYIQRTVNKELPESLDTTGWIKIILKHFGTEPYLYKCVFNLLYSKVKNRIKKVFYRQQ